MARKAKAAQVVIADSRLSRVTIVPTIVSRKAVKLSWQALCTAARGTKYAYSELSKGVKVGLATPLD